MIRTCLFDMGNVLVHFCHDRMCAQLAEVCGTEAPRMRQMLFDDGLLAEFERGRLSEAELQTRLEAEVGRPLDREQLLRAGSDIFSLNASMVPLLDQLKAAGFRLVLLSNTSISHLNWVRQEWTVLQRFDALVTSYAAGAIKPEPAIFAAALDAAECAPDECFYTDDIPTYVEAARRFGIDAEVYLDTPTLCDHLRQRGVLPDSP